MQIIDLIKKALKLFIPMGTNKEISSPDEFVEVRREDIDPSLFSSWQDPSVPQRQYDACTKGELKNYREGLPIKPYDVLVDIFKENFTALDGKTVLEIGCSTGYYSDVLKIKGINAEYHGCDYSESFIGFARKLFPGTDFQVQDACSLTYPDKSFDIVISGGCLLHIMDYEKAIEGTARVAKEYVVFHRTPVLHKKETSYYIKTAYGVKMFEIHFNEREFLRLLRNNGLTVQDIITFNALYEKDIDDIYAYKTYMCSKKT